MKKITMYRVYVGAYYIDKWQLSKVIKYINNLSVAYVVKKYVGTRNRKYRPRLTMVIYSKKHKG